ncbi:MAG TPA: cupin domain-containing protein, partial [Candidatus Limnocylindria bacterium]|nr:cupin domain-containing protein [Candidatus Limnocylindria bacterium]
MGDFYSDWLRASARLESSVGHGPVVARGRELAWIETPQDSRAAMLIGAASGFPTQGTALVTAEIPAGWRTGRHVHGEEAIHVTSGTGFSIIGGARYDWKAGTTLHVPYRAEHQHVNTGDTPAVYVSALTQDLDFSAGLGRLEQLEEKATGYAELAKRYPAESSQFAADGRRIALHLEDAIDEKARRLAGHAHPKAGKGAHRHAGI